MTIKLVLSKEVAEIKEYKEHQSTTIVLLKLEVQDKSQVIAMRDQEIEELKSMNEKQLKNNLGILATNIRMSKEKDDLNTDIASLKVDIEEWKKQNAILKSELGARKCVTDSCEEEIKLLKREVDSLRKEAEVAEFFETITNPKPVSKMSRRQK